MTTSSVSVQSALSSYMTLQLNTPLSVSDSSQNVLASLDQLQIMASAKLLTSINLTDATAGITLTVSGLQLQVDTLVLSEITNNFSLNVTGYTSAASLSTSLASHIKSVAVLDNGANVGAHLDAISAVVSAGGTVNTVVGDLGIVSVDSANYSAYSVGLATITSPYILGTDLTSEAITASSNSHVPAISLTSSSSDILSHLDALQNIAATGELKSIALTDGGLPVLSLTAAQLANDAKALADITSFYTMQVSAGTSSTTITGLAGHGATVDFSGTAASYTVTSDAQGNLTVTNGTVTDHLSNVTALAFSDHTEIIAQTPGTSSVTTGNITELYGAVFGREPDVAGLAYYQAELAANPAIPLSTFALWFLASPEYINNSAHTYAPTAAGDANFVADSYTNLLHRAPEAGATDWYEANVINPILGNTTPGTAAYTTALALAHAQVLVDFSASDEFLGDVKITAQHPADSQHWLVLT